MQGKINEILDFWFGELDDTGLCVSDHNKLWFSADTATDGHCRTAFSNLLEQARAGDLDAWTETDTGLVALIVLLDQFSRNIHRGTAKAFAGDTKALQLAQQAIADGRHLALPLIHRVFLFLTLEHSESPANQAQCLELFSALEQIAQDQQFAGFTRFARAHKDVIDQFERFPHRNVILGRESTPEEEAFMKTHGGF